MRHQVRKTTLGRTKGSRKAVIKTLCSSLILHGKVQTTLAKAKAVRPYAETCITLSRQNNVHSRRQALRYCSPLAVSKLHLTLSKRFENRHGGYCRIIKLSTRKGDGSPQALIELV